MAPTAATLPNPVHTVCHNVTILYLPISKKGTIAAGSVLGVFGVYFLLMVIAFIVTLSRRKPVLAAAPLITHNRPVRPATPYAPIPTRAASNHTNDASTSDTTGITETTDTSSPPPLNNTPDASNYRRTSSTTNLTVYVPATQRMRSPSTSSVNLIPLQTTSSPSSSQSEGSVYESDEVMRPQRSRASSTTARYYYPEQYVEDMRNSVVMR